MSTNKLAKISILYLGDSKVSSTSCHRAQALRRLGCKVMLIDPSILIGHRRRWQKLLDYRTGFCFVQKQLQRAFQRKQALIAAFNPDLIWINGGEKFGPRVLQWLTKTFKSPAVLYNNDDPTGWRDGQCFASLRAALPLYTFTVFCRQETTLEALSMGARRAIRVWMSYDELHHSAKSIGDDSYFKKIVSFVGTHIPGEARDQFLVALADCGLPLRIRGNLWHKSSLYSRLRLYHAGAGVAGAQYTEALHEAAISLGLLSHQNRDLSTQRSFETPAACGLLCAERTSEHQLLYEDGYEAVFWNGLEECIQRCNLLLRDKTRNIEIRTRGQLQILASGIGNEDICRQILHST
jgi:spore maturation protein CgeB